MENCEKTPQVRRFATPRPSVLPYCSHHPCDKGDPNESIRGDSSDSGPAGQWCVVMRKIFVKLRSTSVTLAGFSGISNMRLLSCLSALALPFLLAQSDTPAAQSNTPVAQSDAPAPVFDAADVHVSPAGVRDGGIYLHANRLELHGVTMLSLITTAYGVPEDKVFGGPNWLDTDRFEIVAKAEKPVTTQNFQPMLQALLADRFQLKIGRQDKPEQIFVLTATKHVQLKESATPGDPQCKRANDDGYLGLVCQNVTMANLAENLPGAARNYFDHPVVDRTGLTGKYDLKLKWSGRGQLGVANPDHPGISLFDFLEKELGIKAEPQTRPAMSLVIEKVNEAPVPNPPGTIEKLPPQITEFEVAEVRPSKPGTEMKYDMTNGRLEAYAVTIKDMVGFAYNLEEYMLPGGEKWLDDDKFDVIAKADPTVTDGTLRAMLRTLLAERFHLKSHFEEQPVGVWALTAPKGKGKLNETNGEQHAGCTRTPKDGAFTLSCRNTTMTQFAAKLPNIGGASAYLDEHPMVDLTGLKGSYDFEITWSPPGRFAKAGLPGGGPVTAAVPTGGVTLYEAIDKQLGLKLSVEKHSMPVVVIDHADRTPTEN